MYHRLSLFGEHSFFVATSVKTALAGDKIHLYPPQLALQKRAQYHFPPDQ